MNIIIPMAGKGKRMRPHTLTIPKPLIQIAGKPIVQRLVEDIAKSLNEPITQIGFVIGDFGKETEEQLHQIAAEVGAKSTIYYQHQALGTAHAILCAEEMLHGKTIIAFADTLFKTDFKLNTSSDAIIWAHHVEDPSAFGVLKLDNNNLVTNFIEKPKNFVSDLAIIGIYYFSDAEKLKTEMQFLIDNNIQKSGEFQLTDALETLKNKGLKFSIATVQEWLDCGNKDATVYTNQRILEINKTTKLISKTARFENSVIINPCYFGENVKITNSVIGPHVSIGDNSTVEYSVISNSIIQTNCKLSCINIDNSMIGNYVEYATKEKDVSIGDYTTITF